MFPKHALVSRSKGGPSVCAVQLRPPGPGVGLVHVRRLTWFPGAEEWAAVQKLVQLLHSDHWVQPPSEEALAVYIENIENIEHILLSGSLYVGVLWW